MCSLAVCHDKLDEITDAEKVLLQACEISKYKNASGSQDDILLASNAFENLGLIYVSLMIAYLLSWLDYVNPICINIL